MVETIIKVENLGKKYFLYGSRTPRRVELKQSMREVVNSLVTRILHLDRSGSSYAKKEEFWALKDISFEVKRGEVVGIIGRNGAGKSTLLKILSRITEPTTGRIRMHGRVISLLEVGTGFHPELNGRENIYLNGAILGMTKAEIDRKFEEIVAFAEIEKFLSTPVKRYSSGMYVRLAFSVAAHLEPEILIVDEVLAVGDQAFQKKCLGKMDDVVKQGRTVLFVSHNMGAIRQLCFSGIWIEDGSIKAQGRSDVIVKNYLSSLKKDISAIKFDLKSNVNLQIRKIRLLDENGRECTDFPRGTMPILEVDYIINESVRGLHVACILTSSDDYHIFSTADTDLKPYLLGQLREPGEYIARIRLPVADFNIGDYYVAIGIGLPGIEVMDRQNGPTLTLHDIGGFGTMKEKNGRTGLLLAQVPWVYKKWASANLNGADEL